MDNEIKKQIVYELIDTFINAGKKVINAKNVELKKQVK